MSSLFIYIYRERVKLSRNITTVIRKLHICGLECPYVMAYTRTYVSPGLYVVESVTLLGMSVSCWGRELVCVLFSRQLPAITLAHL